MQGYIKSWEVCDYSLHNIFVIGVLSVLINALEIDSLWCFMVVAELLLIQRCWRYLHILRNVVVFWKAKECLQWKNVWDSWSFGNIATRDSCVCCWQSTLCCWYIWLSMYFFDTVTNYHHLGDILMPQFLSTHQSNWNHFQLFVWSKLFWNGIKFKIQKGCLRHFNFVSFSNFQKVWLIKDSKL